VLNLAINLSLTSYDMNKKNVAMPVIMDDQTIPATEKNKEPSIL